MRLIMKFLRRNLLSLILCSSLVLSQKYVNVPPDIYLSITELIMKYGYPVETHEIVTEDGYILTIYRIPHGKNGTGYNKKAILMVHGYAGQTEQYVLGGMLNASIAFYCADRGYDVWLGTTRGSPDGRKHVTLKVDDPKFWNFSFHEIGLYDLPPMMDYILLNTGKKKLYYVGHSQGGTMFYVLCSMRPEYQEKFALASLLAPVIYTKDSNVSVILPFSKNLDLVTRFANSAQIYVLPPPPLETSDLLLELCFGRIRINLCENVYKTLYGNSGEIDTKIFPLVVHSIPSIGIRQLLHYAQNMDSGYFRQYDYGKTRNMEIYGTPDPPLYHIENIQVPVAIYYSPEDILISPTDIEQQCKRIAKCKRKYRMRNPKWNHLDYLAPKNLDRDLGRPLVDFMEKFDDH